MRIKRRNAVRKRASAPVDASAWVRAALQALSAGGVAAVSVEALARSLGVTKGSFYWHFESREALLKAALQRYEQMMDRILGQLRESSEPLARLSQLFHAAVEHMDGLYMALSPSTDQPVVREVIQRISEQQLAFARQALMELGFSPEQAQMRSFLAYALYIGILHFARNEPERLPPREALDAYADHAVALVIRP